MDHDADLKFIPVPLQPGTIARIQAGLDRYQTEAERERAWLNGEIACEQADGCPEAAEYVDPFGKLSCDWHASTDDRQAMMPRQRADQVRVGTWTVINGVQDLVIASQAGEGGTWLLDLRIDGPKVFRPDRLVITLDPTYLTKGAPA
jgi:hypothetical protein